MAKNGLWILILALGVTLIAVACTSDSTQTLQAVATATPTPTLIAGGRAPSEDEPPPSGCPEVDMIYQLDYIHELVLDQPDELHLEMIAEQDAAFFLTIHEDGTIDSEDFENSVSVSFTGTVEDCTIEGENQLFADISGFCSEGIATLQIVEYYDDLSFTEICPDGTGTFNAEYLVSAPVNQFEFELKEDGDTKVVEYDLGISAAYYSWTLFEHGLAVVPLVPSP